MREYLGPVFVCALLITSCSGGEQADSTVTGAAGSPAADAAGELASACPPGLQRECPCLNGTAGIQVCRADGSGYEPCVCPDSGSPGDASPSDAGSEAESDAGEDAELDASDAPLLGDVPDDANAPEADSPFDSGSEPEAPVCVPPCDDGDLCTEDTCLNGTCSFIPINPDDGNACTEDSCDPKLGILNTIVPTDDSDLCTADSCESSTGEISHDLIVVDDHNACTVDSCEPLLGISHIPISIDDDDLCTADECNTVTGTISHSVIDTDDHDACTIDSCDPETGTVAHSALGVDDGNACTSDWCDPKTGVKHVPNWSEDWNKCTTESCDPVSGAVTRTAISDCWVPISQVGAPSARGYHVAVWTGSRMIVWGGIANGDGTNSGGIYDPDTNKWEATWQLSAPQATWDCTAVWFDSKMVVLGGIGMYGYNGGADIYDPAHYVWTGMSGPADEPKGWHNPAVVAGPELLFWGGAVSGGSSKGGWRFPNTVPGINGSPMPDAPVGRAYHSAVWTGARMIVYGGLTDLYPIEGGHQYDPVSNSWAVIANEPPPTFPYRWEHAAAWTGSKMLVWGGWTASGFSLQSPRWVTSSGAAYDPGSNTWAPMAEGNAPSARFASAVVWTGSKMIIWGGSENNGGPVVGTGGVYDPTAGAWHATSTTGQPSARWRHTAVWTGEAMLVWGGINDALHEYKGDGALYYP